MTQPDSLQKEPGCLLYDPNGYALDDIDNEAVDDNMVRVSSLQFTSAFVENQLLLPRRPAIASATLMPSTAELMIPPA